MILPEVLLIHGNFRNDTVEKVWDQWSRHRCQGAVQPLLKGGRLSVTDGAQNVLWEGGKIVQLPLQNAPLFLNLPYIKQGSLSSPGKFRKEIQPRSKNNQCVPCSAKSEEMIDVWQLSHAGFPSATLTCNLQRKPCLRCSQMRTQWKKKMCGVGGSVWFFLWRGDFGSVSMAGKKRQEIQH